MSVIACRTRDNGDENSDPQCIGFLKIHIFHASTSVPVIKFYKLQNCITLDNIIRTENRKRANPIIFLKMDRHTSGD